MRTTRSVAAVVVTFAALTLTSCSSDTAPDSGAPADRGTSQTTPSTESAPASSTPATPSDSGTPTEEPAPDSPLLSVSISGDEVLPNAQEIDLAVGEELMVEVVSDRAGELHVHAKPEQYVEFGAGTANAKLVIDTPGSVEIEDHDTGAVVALLEVR